MSASTALWGFPCAIQTSISLRRGYVLSRFILCKNRASIAGRGTANLHSHNYQTEVSIFARRAFVAGLQFVLLLNAAGARSAYEHPFVLRSTISLSVRSTSATMRFGIALAPLPQDRTHGNLSKRPPL